MKKQNKVVVLTETQKQELIGYAAQVNLLQTEIVSNDNIAIQHGKNSLELAIKAGGFLRDAKKIAGHGNWQKWVKENVPSISKRTVENYMKLSERAEGDASLVNEVEGLRQAYKRIGICTEKTNVEPTTLGNGASDNATVTPTISPEATSEKAGDKISPEKMKETDAGQYQEKCNNVRQKAILHVRETIEASSKLDWNLSTWLVKNNKPCSGDEANYGAALFHELKTWVAKQEYQELTREDEIITKTGIVLSEVVKSFITANTTSTPEVEPLVKLSDMIPTFSYEVNPHPVAAVKPPVA
jgi:Protein of unknown function (DUF3102)